MSYRDSLVSQMTGKVKELNRENFAVRQHLKYVDMYSVSENYKIITYEDTLSVKEELAPLIVPEKDNAEALRFDALMYGIELACLTGKKHTRAISDLRKKAAAASSVATIPEVKEKQPVLEKILNTDYVENADISELEEIRQNLRDLMKYIIKEHNTYDTNFTDEILDVSWNESELENDDLKNYKAKAEFYIRQHQTEGAIAKLKNNEPLSNADIDSLEKILWSDIGSRADYRQELGEKPLGEFVREIVGLDMNAAKTAFAEYLDETNLDSRQIYFVNQIVEYIVHNGMMKDLSVLQESPFTDNGSVVEVFTDMSVWLGIRNVIETINKNAAA
jgi:type I restriction enzyme R subunit